MLEKIRRFLEYEVWRISTKTFPKYKIFLLRQLRVVLLAFRGSREDKVSLRASALTFYTMLSVVPVVAMVFGIAKGFGMQKMLQEELKKQFYGQEEVMEYIIDFANSFLESTRGGIIAGAGLVILFWSVMKVLGNIESSFNAIWQVRKPRVWFRKFSDYFSMMLVAPVLFILSSSSTVFITTQVEQIIHEVELLGMISPLIFFLVKLIPYVLIWSLLTVIYMVMPNTKVNFRSALIAGIIAGTAFAFLQWIYVKFQIGVSRYNAIYGSFAALPLFLIWLQLSWRIVLLGAEISFADQNVERYEFEPDVLNISPFSKKVIVLMVSHQLIKNFEEGKPAYTTEYVSKTLEIPIRLASEAIYELQECGIITEVKTKNEKERAYQPAIDINKLSLSYVLEALEHKGVDKILTKETTLQHQLVKTLRDFQIAVQNNKGSTLIKDL